MSVRVDFKRSHWGFQVLMVENEIFRVTIFLEVGGKIWDLYYKPAGCNFLWHNPRVELRRVTSSANFDDVWPGGWDEVFPNDSPDRSQGEDYPDHGEL
ncbi:MAG: DUF5107 domain-containing protein [Firmicutes bacterium]|nr:DUF5107 domain-containing protein [Bacillota bacterium]